MPITKPRPTRRPRPTNARGPDTALLDGAKREAREQIANAKQLAELLVLVDALIAARDATIAVRGTLHRDVWALGANLRRVAEEANALHRRSAEPTETLDDATRRIAVLERGMTPYAHARLVAPELAPADVADANPRLKASRIRTREVRALCQAVDADRALLAGMDDEDRATNAAVVADVEARMSRREAHVQRLSPRTRSTNRRAPK